MKKLLIVLLLLFILLNICNYTSIEKFSNHPNNNLYNISYNTLFQCKNIYSELKNTLNERFNSNELDVTLQELDALDKELEVICKERGFNNGCLNGKSVDEDKMITNPFANE